MIWFACKQCGKTHSRSESSAGTLVFCECGQGNLVPWESTMAEPEALPAAPAPSPPRLEPIPFGEQRRQPPPLPPRAEPIPVDDPRQQPSPPPVPRRRPFPADDERERPSSESGPRRRRQRRRERDPNFCFNHDWLAAAESCASCKERFCLHCVIQFDDKLLCGPCKNEQIRVLTRPPRQSALAITAWLVALASGAVPTCLVPVSLSAGSAWLVMLALAPQMLAFLLGTMALHAAEANPKLSGRSLAITAIVTAGVGAILTVGITLYGFVHWV